MDVATRHPELTAERLAEWQTMSDAMDGESAMKLRGVTYLPMPGGFRGKPDGGTIAYGEYKARAQFPEILTPSLAAMVGIIHDREIKIEMPPAMDFLWEDADGAGLPLEAFHRRLTRGLLALGRQTVLVDAPAGGGQPYMRGYAAGALTNWDADWYVLDEGHMARDGFKWVAVEQYRVLSLEKGAYVQQVYTKPNGKDWTASTTYPVAQGGKRLMSIPIAVANARDVSLSIQPPPLIGVARAALAIYQLSADYRYQLFMSGQETMVAINGKAPAVVGAGVIVEMIGGEGMTPDLKYVSPTCSGIDAHKVAMEDNRIAAVQAGARLLEQSDQVQESGAARKLRFASETATLTSVAQVSCGLLERSLRNIAVMLNLPTDGIVVTPPQDLLDNTMTPADAQALVAVWQSGGISYETLHENLTRGGIASPERSSDEEYALTESEGAGDTTAL